MRTRLFLETEEGLQDQGLLTDMDIPVAEGMWVHLLTENRNDEEYYEKYTITSVGFVMRKSGENISVEKQIILT